MKISFQLIGVLVLLHLLACNEKKPSEKVDTVPEKEPVVKQENPIVVDQKIYEYFYVSALSGLNYRDAPKGEVLGKFPLNTRLKILLNTGVVEQIVDGNKPTKGEWVGVANDKDTVYVFNAFLSDSMIFSDLEVYYASPDYQEGNDSHGGFVNLSESYTWDYETETSTILAEKDLGKNAIRFDQRRKSKFLKTLRLSENDSVYIYNLPMDEIYKFRIKDLPVIALVNIYAQGDEILKEYDYEFGFDLGKKYAAKGENFVVIGKSNPFQTGKAESVIWTQIDQEDFPNQSNQAEQEKLRKDGYTLGLTYQYSNNNFDYFIQNMEKNGIMDYRQLVVKDLARDKFVYNETLWNSESRSVMPLTIKNEESNHGIQWTGAIFKDQPPIIYGFIGYSFGCPSIEFLSEKAPPILIRCDNRH